jgi:hypothetical protein
MGELKSPGVEQVSGEVTPLAVKRVAGDRMTEMLEMDADLVGATGARHAGDEGPSVAGSEEFVVGDGITAGGGAAGRHLLALDGVASDGQINGSLGVPGGSPDDGKIGFLDLTIGELRGEGGMGLVVLGDNDASAGLLIKTMNDAGAMFTGTTGEGSDMVKESVDEGSLLVARADMDDHPGRFVDNEEICVLVEDLERDLLRSCTSGCLRRFLLNEKKIPFLNFVVIAHRHAPEGDPARFDERLDLGSGEVWKMTDQDHVKTLARIRGGGGDFVDGVCGHFLPCHWRAA